MCVCCVCFVFVVQQTYAFPDAKLGPFASLCACVACVVVCVDQDCSQEEALEGARWLQKAADLGHKRAQRDLGFLFADGREKLGIARDCKRGVFYLATAGLFGMVRPFRVCRCVQVCVCVWARCNCRARACFVFLFVICLLSSSCRRSATESFACSQPHCPCSHTLVLLCGSRSSFTTDLRVNP